MTRRWRTSTLGLVLAAAAALAGGGDESHHQAEEFPSLALTRFTSRTELFVEFPLLTVDRDSPFAAHVTTLPDFRALSAGAVSVTLSGGGEPEEVFRVDGASSPGIFRPVVRPRHAGPRQVTLHIGTDRWNDRLDMGMHTVHPDQAAARASAREEEEDPSAITFLKEQQWRVDFAMERAARRELRPALEAYGSLMPRSGGRAEVRVPSAGRLIAPPGGFPPPGTRVARGALLARLSPQLEGGSADLPSLELAVTSQQLRLDFLTAERARLAPLVESGAIPERRLQLLANEERSLTAELEAAHRRLDQYRTLQGGSHSGARPDAPLASVALTAPLTGTVVYANAVDGAYVAAEAPLFRLVDTDVLWLETLVPEADAGALAGVSAASFTVEGSARVYEVGGGGPGRLVSLGVTVDPDTRCVPVVFEVPNPGRDLRAGVAARVRLFSGEPVAALAIPTSAVVEDGGLDVAFVQLGGESYARRILTLGRRDRGLVEVLAGISEGDWVVTRGAWLVRLAGSSGSVPAHGHAH